MAAKKKAGRKKKISLQEFRAWLEGVEELQPDGWGPDATQWQLIRGKLECIVEAPPQLIAPVQQQPMQQGPPPGPVPRPTFTAPPSPSGVPPGVVVENREIPSGPIPPGVIPPGAQGVAGQAGVGPVTKTPEIDTTNGNYDSSFA